MYTVVGGNPFSMYTGTTTFTSLRVVGTSESFEEAKSILRENWETCAGLMILLFNGQEVSYDENGEPIEPIVTDQ